MLFSDPFDGRSYFEALAEDKNSSGDCLWVGLNFRGRVFGSDFGCPIWDEVLAAMPPIKRLSSLEERYALADAASGALEAQEEFYRALCEGDKQAMAAIFAAGLQWHGMCELRRAITCWGFAVTLRTKKTTQSSPPPSKSMGRQGART